MKLSWLRLAFLLLIPLSLGGTVQESQSPRLIIDESVHSDFEAVIEDAWDQFAAVFAARLDCFGSVTVKADYDLADRAVYDAETDTISIRVPERKGLLQGALIHEWGHQIEFNCPAHEELRAPFKAAQGLPADTAWYAGSSVNLHSNEWSHIPSEQYAEAAILAVLGSRPAATNTRINWESVMVVKRWAKGDQP